MKKTLVSLLAVFAFTIVFTSCTKEGQYMPSKKISEIVRVRSHKVGELVVSSTESERWTWNGKVLSYIDYYNADGDRTRTALFRYDKDNRIEEVEVGVYSIKYDYDNNHLDDIEVVNTNSGAKVQEMEFTYDGGKLATIDVKTNDGKGAESYLFNPLRFVVPENMAEMVMSQSAVKGTQRYTFTWTGNNITEMTDGRGNSVKYSYDKNTNPFKGFLNVEQTFDLTYSANNVIRQELYDNGALTVLDYEYVYDGKYPTRVKYQSESSTLVPGYTLMVDHVTEYKY